MEEIFYKRVEDYIKSKKVEIIQNINQKECSYLLENETEYIKSLADQFTADPITVDFDDIDYTEEKAIGYYRDGTPVDVITYTFKVPFKGKAELLNYRSNKGKYKDKTYFVEGDHIYFKSRNFDLKPVDKRFANTIDILKSIINNLNKDYVNWNNNLPDFVKRNIETRKNSLMKFKEFCKKHELSKEEIQKMKFKLSAIETLSQIIGETYTGSGITTLFKKAGYPEIVHDGTTKRKFVCETFENMQEESNEGFYKILKVLEVVCDPQEYILNPDLHEEVLEKVNRVLRFYGLKFTDEGILNQLENKQTKLKTNAKTQIIPNNDTKHEIFISHSSKDKDLVNKLYNKLEEKGIKTWYDDAELTIGDNLREKINKGLNECDYGIVVLSEYFIDSFWTKREYDSLFTLMEDGKLFPINHGLTKEQLESFDKSLSNIIYRDTRKYSLDEIVDEIYRKIRK